MTTEDADGLVLAMAAELVRLHEGWRQRAYDDATGEPLRPGHTLVGNPTVGWGRNLRDVGIRRHEAEILLAEDLKEAIGRARSFAGSVWDGLSVERRSVLTDMAFNLGGRLMSFRRFRAALLRGDFEVAAREMLDSRWARQVGRRAETLAAMMRGDAGGRVAFATGTGAVMVRRS